MRWIVIGFIAFITCAYLYEFARALWAHDGLGAIAAAVLVIWGGIALYGSI